MNKILLASLIGLAAVGCQNNTKSASSTLPPTNAAVTEVASPAVYTPPPPMPVQQPVIYDTPAVTSSTPAAEKSSAKAGGTYKVQKGDTLFAIAKRTYGDGKQWKKIQAANPGLSASSLKAGQTINLP